jgi:hypothetical protein
VYLRSFILRVACAVVAIACAMICPASAEAPRSLDLHADHIAFYSNRYVVSADGHVRVRLTDGTVITGDTFSMDLKLNRYLIAGNVEVRSGTVDDHGAAFAGYPDLDRAYFLPATPKPDRWTFLGADYANPAAGRQQPGDAFYFPDLSDDKPYVIAHSATIVPKTMVQFDNAGVYALSPFLPGLGPAVPVLGYNQPFSSNPNFLQNDFAGAILDIGNYIYGTPHSLTGIHLRYDAINHLYFSYDQHFVWGPDYVVLSVNPATTLEKQWNFLGYDQLSPATSIRGFYQLSTLGHAFTLPSASGDFGNETYIARIGKAFAGLNINVDHYNADLIPSSPFEQNKDHPSNATASLLGYPTKIILDHTPIIDVKLRTSYGFAHDGFHCGFGATCPAAGNGVTDTSVPGPIYLENFFGTPVTTVYDTMAGINAVSHPFVLNHKPRGAAGALTLNANFDKQRDSYSLPHHVDETQTNVSLAEQYGAKLAVFANANFTATGDYYGARQSLAYPAYPPTLGINGVTYFNLTSFRGLTSSQDYTESVVVTPNPYFNFSLTLSEVSGFPGNIPGVIGGPPVQLLGNVRVRLAKHIGMQLSRTYLFNYFMNTWSPGFGIQFTP